MSNGVELFKKLSFGKKIRLSIIALIVGIMVLAPIVAAAKTQMMVLCRWDPSTLVRLMVNGVQNGGHGYFPYLCPKTLSMMMEQDNSLPKHNQEMCGF